MLLPEMENATFDSTHPGNARWMAPEFVLQDLDEDGSEEDSEIQLLRRRPTLAGDIYSLGCLMLQVC
jgi:serine/threonine protein kinase